MRNAMEVRRRKEPGWQFLIGCPSRDRSPNLFRTLPLNARFPVVIILAAGNSTVTRVCERSVNREGRIVRQLLRERGVGSLTQPRARRELRETANCRERSSREFRERRGGMRRGRGRTPYPTLLPLSLAPFLPHNPSNSPRCTVYWNATHTQVGRRGGSAEKSRGDR